MLTTKELIVAVKHHIPISQICEKYSIPEDEFDSVVFTTVGKDRKKANEILSSLKKNSKKKKGKKTSDVHASYETEEKIISDSDEDIVIDEITFLSLEELTRLRDSKSQVICNLETEFYDIRNQRTAQYQEIEKAAIEMRRLEKEYWKQVDFIHATKIESDKLSDAMDEISAKRKSLRAECDALDIRIQELKTVHISVVDGGFYNNLDEEIDIAFFEGFEEIYRTLLEREEDVLDLKKTQLKTIAKAVAYQKTCEFVIFEFDDAEVETAFRFLS